MCFLFSYVLMTIMMPPCKKKLSEELRPLQSSLMFRCSLLSLIKNYNSGLGSMELQFIICLHWCFPKLLSFKRCLILFCYSEPYFQSCCMILQSHPLCYHLKHLTKFSFFFFWPAIYFVQLVKQAVLSRGHGLALKAIVAAVCLSLLLMFML